MTTTPRQFDGVIFDMDGTLTEPLLDFGAIRRELGIAPEAGILEAVAAMPEGPRQRAQERLLEIELAAARDSRMTPGADRLLEALCRAGLKSALLTRNAREAMRIILERFGFRFDLAWSREDGPIKPEPDGVRRACEALSIRPARTACVGDFQFDLVAANAAGACSILLDRRGDLPFAHLARHVVASLDELYPILGLD
ncbi:MAG: HAD family hydrolase [Planctomycetota bacterium]|nr:HAD family hydrolase [Planctomycetota bacterium]